MARSVRPRALAVGFGIFFVLIAFFAWGFAQAQAGIWYPADLTRWVYTTYMLVAAIFLVGLGGLGISVRRSFTRQIHEIDRHLGGAHDLAASTALPPPLPETTTTTKDRVDRDIDELLESLTEIETTSAKEAAAMEADAAAAGGSGLSSSSEAALAARRVRLLQRQRFLGRFVAGPGVVVAFILGISGLMLPGSDGFAQTNFQFNTALILGIGYSWIGVGAYVAATIAALASGGKDERRTK